MRFRSGAKLDPSRSPTRAAAALGGPVLAGGGGLGVVGLVIFVLYTVLAGGSGDLGGLGSLDGQSVSTGRPVDARPGLPDGCGRERAAGLPDRRRRQQHPGLLGRRRARLHAGEDGLLHGLGADGLRLRELAGRPVLLPCRQAGLHRPRLLRRAAVAVRRRGRPVRRGLRARARVRPPHPGSHRHAQARAAGQRPRGRLGADGAPGRLLRGRLGEPRRRDGADREPHPGGHQQRHRRRGRRRRRSHPGAHPGPGRIPRPGRTARRSSAGAGSRRATRPAGRRSATRSPARSEPTTRRPTGR